MQLISRKPNFFLIGAPKCGTTSLAHYLGEHPDIFMSYPKEPFYFSPDVVRTKGIETDADYLKLFTKVRARHVAIGEASTSYLYSDVAVPEILRFNPEARFIVCLRHPVDMVYSLHSHLLHTVGYEDIQDFRQAWLTQEKRARIKLVWRGGLFTPKFLCYADQCKLGFLLERLYQTVPREKVFCVFSEDLGSNPKRVYEDVLSFLGVASDERSEFPTLNQNVILRSSILFHIHGYLKSLSNIKNALFPQTNFGLSQLYMKTVPRQKLPEDFRQELLDYFADDIAKLAALTARDLSHWLQGAVKSAGVPADRSDVTERPARPAASEHTPQYLMR